MAKARKAAKRKTKPNRKAPAPMPRFIHRSSNPTEGVCVDIDDIKERVRLTIRDIESDPGPTAGPLAVARYAVVQIPIEKFKARELRKILNPIMAEALRASTYADNAKAAEIQSAYVNEIARLADAGDDKAALAQVLKGTGELLLLPSVSVKSLRPRKAREHDKGARERDAAAVRELASLLAAKKNRLLPLGDLSAAVLKKIECSTFGVPPALYPITLDALSRKLSPKWKRILKKYQ